MAFNDTPMNFRTPRFVGRDKDLAHLARGFGISRGGGDHGGVPRRFVLFGKQGVGKSHLTAELARSSFARGQHSYVFWLSASTVEKLHRGYSRLLHLVGHPDRVHPEVNVRLKAAKRWLEEEEEEEEEEVDTGNWFLVLDDVSHDVLGFLGEHLPCRNARGTIFFTTRTERCAFSLECPEGQQQEVFHVGVLDVVDAVKLFFTNEQVNGHPTKVKELVIYLGLLPLAISQALAYMKQTGKTVEELLTWYHGKMNVINNAVKWKNKEFTYYDNILVAVTIGAQLAELERQSPDAVRFLKVVAFLDPDGIQLDMLINGAEAISNSRLQASSRQFASVPKNTYSFMRNIKNKILRKGKPERDGKDSSILGSLIMPSLLALIQSPTALQSAIGSLQNVSLLQRSQNDLSSDLCIHDIIQFAVIDHTNKDGSDGDCFECAVELACNAFRQMGDSTSTQCWPECEALIPHIQYLTKRNETYNNANATKSLLLTRHEIARYYDSRGRHSEAEKLYGQLSPDLEQLFGLAHSCTRSTMNQLAGVYQSRERFVDAETLLVRVLEVERNQLGSDHIDTLKTMGILASVYESQGRHADAEALLVRVLEGTKRQLGPDHIDSLTTVHNLASVYLSQGRYDEAEAMLDQVLPSMEKHLGSEHIASLTVMHNLAAIYKFQGRYIEAEEMFDRVLSREKSRLGSEHPSTLATMHNLAGVYYCQDRYHDAEASLNEVLAGRENRLGSNHLDTLATRHNLARVYHSQGRFSEAEALATLVLTSREKLLGSDHIDTLTTMQILARTYEAQGRDADAEALLVQVLPRREEVLGVCHPRTQSTIQLLQRVDRKLGRSEQADALNGRAAGQLCSE